MATQDKRVAENRMESVAARLNHLAFAVIPAKAGIHMLRTSEFMDSRLRGNDNPEIVGFNLGENDSSVLNQKFVLAYV